ncbi:MAG: hypothetical protein M0P47_02295 [Bacteroidales bacterium]|nr:hypothetical protein [Bacteroidales bacterium]
MSKPAEPIVDFIEEHHVLTLAISRDNIPYCATCFYAYLREENRFIITSDHDTRHIRDCKESGNYRIAGSIALETKMVGKIQGIQFTGMLHELSGDDLNKARKTYLNKFPIARMTPRLNLWELIPEFIKMTDNRFGFGKKLIWK